MIRITSQQFTLAIVCIVAVMIALDSIPQIGAQITFSKDWRGGKRSTLTANSAVSLVDIPCDQMNEYSNTKIRDLVRKEAVALLQCEFKRESTSSANVEK